MKPVIRKETPYKHIFIDFDSTLWDFENNSREVLMELYHRFQLFEVFNGFGDFFTHYTEYNTALWDLYRKTAIDKDELIWKRFLLTIQEAGIDDEQMAKKLSEEYLNISPTKRKLFPHVKFGLTYLKKQYSLHLITNGFKKVQHNKLINCELDGFFTGVFTSEELGVQKPETSYFTKALHQSNANKKNSVVIGDNFSIDIMGAANADIDQIWFNPKKIKSPAPGNDIPTMQFAKWKEIIHIL
jgi:putative hydrolase of the HAD superfamily